MVLDSCSAKETGRAGAVSQLPEHCTRVPFLIWSCIDLRDAGQELSWGEVVTVIKVRCMACKRFPAASISDVLTIFLFFFVPLFMVA